MPVLSAVMKLIWAIGVSPEPFYEYEALPNLARAFKVGDFHIR